MSYQAANPGSSDLKTQLVRRGPGRPAVIEKARNPRQALVRLLLYLKPYRLGMGLVLLFVLI